MNLKIRARISFYWGQTRYDVRASRLKFLLFVSFNDHTQRERLGIVVCSGRSLHSHCGPNPNLSSSKVAISPGKFTKHKNYGMPMTILSYLPPCYSMQLSQWCMHSMCWWRGGRSQLGKLFCLCLYLYPFLALFHPHTLPALSGVTSDSVLGGFPTCNSLFTKSSRHALWHVYV